MKLIKRLFTSISLAMLLMTPAIAIEPGQSAPEFKAATKSSEFKLSDHRGKIIYLDFWASWCGPCKKSFPWMNSLQEKFAAQGLQIIAINLDSKHEDSALFLSKVPANFLIGFDTQGTIAKQYQVKAMPSSVLIDREGKVITVHKGFNEGSAKKIEEEIELLLKKP